MRVMLMGTEGLWSSLLLSGIQARQRCETVGAIILPSTGSAHPFRVFRRAVADSGFKFVGYKAIVSGIPALLSLGPHRSGPLSIAHNIPPKQVRRVRSANASETKQFLIANDVDVLVLINVYERLNPEILAIPDVCTLNIHFGQLPKYRGMSPLLWALSHGEPYVGVSLHRATEDFDRGRIVRQQRLTVHPNESLFRLTRRCCDVASSLLPEALEALADDKAAGTDQIGESSYFSLPTRQCVRGAQLHGHALMTLADIRSIRELLPGIPHQEHSESVS